MSDYEPRDPRDPVDPADPVDPVDPVNPVDPVGPVPVPGDTATPTPVPGAGPYVSAEPNLERQLDNDVKPDIGKRAIAAIIDGAIAGAVGLIPAVGGIIGALYILFRDGFDFDFMKGRSVGKTVMKLRPVRLDGGKMDLATSAKRNWTVSLGSLASFLFFIPILGWILYVPVIIAAVVIGIVEIIRVIQSPDGRRWGDALANTKVIEVNE